MRRRFVTLCISVSVVMAAPRTQAFGIRQNAAEPPAPAADQPASPFRVSVRTSWTTSTDADLVTDVVQELATVWKSNGVDVVPWAEESASRPQTTVTLILTKAPPASTPRGALGWIGFLPGAAPLPVIYVSLPVARALIQTASFYDMPVSELPQDLREQLLARVLGRAAAHELGHYLLASREHAKTGLMRTRFTREQWLTTWRDAFRIPPAERAMLAARLRAAQLVVSRRDD